MQRLIIFGVLFALLGLSSGCDNKGPLYLPSEPVEPQQQPPAASQPPQSQE